MNFISTNGLAGKKSYQDNWRFLSENIFSSIIGNVGIHYVDLVGYMCGGIKDIKIEADAIISGKLPDTATIKVYSEICNSEIFISYAAPFKNQALLFLTLIPQGFQKLSTLLVKEIHFLL